MHSMTTNHNPQRRRRVAASALAALVLSGVPSVAGAAPPTTDPTEAPTSSQPVAARSAVVTSQFVHRTAVETGATGFKLQYSFVGGVRPTNQQQSSPIASEKDYIWDDGGNRYLQSDYPMPTDGTAVVTMTAQLIDVGKLTDYTVRYTSTVNRTAGSLAVRTGCEILLGGAPVDLDNDSPFKCAGSSAQSASGAVLAGASVEELNWSSITGVIDVRNEGRGPSISLGDGTFSTPNQQQRIIMNGTAWYPFEATPDEQRKLPYATIANGAELTWSAAQQNPAYTQSEPNSHAQAFFAYRIYLDGVATQYWIKGSAENYKYLQGSEPTATCAVYAGDPNRGGSVTAAPTPFTCVPTGMTKPNVKTDDDTTFEVRMVRVDTLRSSSDAEARGVKAACTRRDGGGCLQTSGPPQLHMSDAANPYVLGRNANLQGAPEPKDWAFKWSWSREVSDSVEQTFGMETEAEVKIPGFFAGKVTITSETSYGYDLSKGLEYSFKDVAKIPFGANAEFVQYEAWHTYTGDLFFLGEGDAWYRITGQFIKVPIEPTTLGADQTGGHVVEPPSGMALGEVQFRCNWEPQLKQKVLLSNNTVEKLAGCDIPPEWGDTIPEGAVFEELPRDLITAARSVATRRVETAYDALAEDAAELASKGA